MTDAARSSLGRALLSDPPVEPGTEQLDLFGQFIGSWRLAYTGIDRWGTHEVTMTGALSFGWVLGGRAVQDVWVVPLPGDPPAGGLTGFHGTTVRFHDPRIDAWRSTWIDPVSGAVRRFIGRPVAAPSAIAIELLSEDDTPHLRWCFRDIRPGSFVWTGETRADRQGSWTLRQTMRATQEESSR